MNSTPDTAVMRSAVCRRPDHIALERVAIPAVGEDMVLLKIICCGVCGSDVAAWQGSDHVRYPYSPGHEFCGTVERMGPGVEGVSVGDRVVVNPNLGCGDCFYCRSKKPNLCDALKTRPIKSNGGFSEYVALDYRMLHPVPDALPSALTPFVEPLSCALHVAHKALETHPSRVAVFGAGIMGIMVGLAMKSRCPSLVIIEPDAGRRAQASSVLGLDALSPQDMATGSAAPLDVAVDCSGSEAAVGTAINALRKAGRLVMAGLVRPTADTAFPLEAVTTKELEVVGAWLNPHVFEDAIALAVESRNVLENLQTRVFRLSDIEKAFKCAQTQVVNKVIVRP